MFQSSGLATLQLIVPLLFFQLSMPPVLLTSVQPYVGRFCSIYVVMVAAVPALQMS